MSLTETGLDRYPGTDTVSLAGLQKSVFDILHKCWFPVEFSLIRDALPPACQESLSLHAKNMSFPSQLGDRSECTFFEEHFVRFGSFVTYIYAEPNGFMLNDDGRQHYRAIMGVDE